MTSHGYVRYTRGCRCAECREAKAAYMREARKRGQEVAASLTVTSTGRRGNQWSAFAPGSTRALVSGIKHGRHGYEVHGCRCQECTSAHSASNRRRSLAS